MSDAKSLIGIWSIIVALSVANLCLLVVHRQRWVNWMKTLNDGATSSMLPMLNTATEVGYGTEIASLAGITGSASGGMSIGLNALGWCSRCWRWSRWWA